MSEKVPSSILERGRVVVKSLVIHSTWTACPGRWSGRVPFFPGDWNWQVGRQHYV